jgi:HEPN domain-containing protein
MAAKKKAKKKELVRASPRGPAPSFVASGLRSTARAWIERAFQHASDARSLRLHNGSPDGLYHFSGQAVEVALKALIMRREGLSEFPSRKQDPGLYSHNLRDLMTRAGLAPLLDAEIKGATDLGANWQAVRDWSYNTSRYPQGRTPREYAVAYYRAVTHQRDGVLTWLNKLFLLPPA